MEKSHSWEANSVFTCKANSSPSVEPESSLPCNVETCIWIHYSNALPFFCNRDQLREVPAQLTAFLTKKHYLHATQLLVSALSLGNGSLEGVEALREVRTDLQAKKQVCATAGFFSCFRSVSCKQMLEQHFLLIPCPILLFKHNLFRSWSALVRGKFQK
jgi:hypothetical protein